MLHQLPSPAAPTSVADAPQPARWWAPTSWLPTLGDYARRVWDTAGEDNIFFLAGGVAFNLLLVAVPFVLLVVETAAWVLNQTPDASAAEVRRLIDLLLPPHPEGPETPIHLLLDSLLKTRGALGVYSAIGFVWFTTRLFGSLRAVLAEVFDIEHERGILLGKLFDIQVTVLATALMIAYFAISVYLAVATSRGVAVLQQLGIRTEVMGGVEYAIGRLLAFAFIVLAFYAAYKYLPNRKISRNQALIGAVTTGIFFELARNLYTYLTARFDPGSLYTGTLYAVISIVFWVYYASLIFILGGEVGQAYAVRRRLRLAKE